MKKAFVPYELDYFHVESGSKTIPTATITLRRGKARKSEASTGNGPVDAAFGCIDRITKTNGRLLHFTIRMIDGGGHGALGKAIVQVELDKRIFTSGAQSTDIIEASARAYLACVNKHLKRRYLSLLLR